MFGALQVARTLVAQGLCDSVGCALGSEQQAGMASLTYAVIVTAFQKEMRRLGHPSSENEWVRGKCLGVRRSTEVLQLTLPR